MNLTHEGLVPRIQKSFLSKDVRGDAAAHPRVRRACGHVHHLPRVRRHAAERGGAVVADRGRQHRRRLRDADQRPRRVGAHPRRAVGRAAARRAAAARSTRSSRSGSATSSLDRPSGTLSGGEAQRTKMIRHLGSSLTDVTYVFDEPTIGLHPHDIQRMNDLLLRLRDKGNTVLVVEHKPETIAIADHVVDLGPGAGSAGGEIVFDGHASTGCAASGTLTGRHLSDRAVAEAVRAHAVGRAGGARREHAQPEERRRRHPVRRARRRDRRRRVGQELADPRLGVRPRRRRVGRSGADPRLAPQQPGDVHRPARADPQGVREGERREAGACSARTPRARARRATARASSTPTSA